MIELINLEKIDFFQDKEQMQENIYRKVKSVDNRLIIVKQLISEIQKILIQNKLQVIELINDKKVKIIDRLKVDNENGNIEFNKTINEEKDLKDFKINGMIVFDNESNYFLNLEKNTIKKI